MAAPTDNSTSESSTNVSDLTAELTGEGVIIDIGTGDGRRATGALLTYLIARAV